MGFFSELGSNLRERKRVIAAVLAFTGIAVAIFFIGTWVGSAGMFTLRPATASTPHPDNAPAAPKPGGMCCDMKMPADKMMPDMPNGMPMPRGAMPTMPSGMPMPNMPSGMPMPSRTG